MSATHEVLDPDDVQIDPDTFGDFYNLPDDVFPLITYNDREYDRYWYDPVVKRLIKRVWNRYRYVKITTPKKYPHFRRMVLQDKYGNLVGVSYYKFIDYMESDASILQGNRPGPIPISESESSDSADVCWLSTDSSST